MSFDDLINIHKKFLLWKDGNKKKCDFKAGLETEICDLKKQRSEVEKHLTIVQDDNSRLNQIILDLTQTVSKLSEFEACNKALNQELEQLKCRLEKSYQDNEEGKLKLEGKLSSLHRQHEEDLRKAKHKAEIERNEQMEVLRNNLKEKDMRICEMELLLEKSEAKKKEELLQQKFKYEERIEKLKRQLSMDKSLTSAPLENADIFRIKSFRLQSDYKEQIKSLEEETRNLKEQNEKLTANWSMYFNVDFNSKDKMDLPKDESCHSFPLAASGRDDSAPRDDSTCCGNSKRIPDSDMKSGKLKKARVTIKKKRLFDSRAQTMSNL